MTTIPLVEQFAKSTVSRDAIELERRDRLTIDGAVSSVITEDTDHWILTTNVRISDDGSAPPRLAHPSPRPASSPGMPMPSLFGVDSLSAPSTGKLSTVTGPRGVMQPAFWGRYFYGPGQTASSGRHDSDHYAPTESRFLRIRNIRVLPIARQTGHVGDPQQAVVDADNNVAALFECFPPGYLAGADPDVLLFLDVEEADNQPTLHPQYFMAWSQRIEQKAADLSGGRVAIRPAMYTSQGASKTFQALRQAMSNGAHCFGVWTARGLSHGDPLPFSESRMLPAVRLECPTLLCQYFLSPDQAPPDENLDMSVCNPAHQDVLINRLVMPPG